jgi:hypothetical protein
MWTKIYLALLAVGVLVTGFFAYYAWSWLQSIGDPRTAWEAFNYHKRAGAYFLVCWTVLLVIVGNIILWTRRSPWAFGVTEIYFVVFTLILLVWLHLSGITFCLENSVCQDPSRAVGPLLTALGSVVLGVGLLINNFVVARLYERMHGKVHIEDPQNESPRSES